MANNTIEDILNELKKANKLLALIALEKLENQKDKILALDKIGFTPKDIAEIVGTTSNSVSVTLSKSRKADAKQK